MASLQTNPAFLNGRSARQAVGSLYLTIALADWLAAPVANQIDFEAPQGSKLIGGSIDVDVASDDTGTDVVHVGDPASADRYHAAVNLKAVAHTELTPTGFETDGSSPAFRLTRAPQNGNATVGSVRVELRYVTRNKSDWTEGAF
jgi:hypothetical protein